MGYYGFLVDEVGPFLLREGRRERDVVNALVGLIRYGVTNKEDLRNISDDDEKFARKLTAKGVPDAVCDLLFKEYVEKEKRRSNEYGLRELFDAQGFNTLITNGINIDKFHLERKLLVDKVIQLTFEKEFLVIGSAPATGKTALLNW